MFFWAILPQRRTFDFSYTSKPSRFEVFKHIKFECQSINSANSFIGTVDGQPFCLLDTNKTDILYGLVTTISTPEPIIDPFGENNAVSTGFNFWMIPKEYKAGNLSLEFKYYSDGLENLTIENYLTEKFIQGTKLPLSTYHISKPPNAAGIEGVSIGLLVYDGFPGVKRGVSFLTSHIIQPDDAYVAYTRSEKIDSNYFIELEVYLWLPSRRRYEGEPEPDMKELKGKFMFKIDL